MKIIRLSQRASLLSALTALAVSQAAADQPLTLSDAQMDQVTAGLGAFVIASANATGPFASAGGSFLTQASVQPRLNGRSVPVEFAVASGTVVASTTEDPAGTNAAQTSVEAITDVPQDAAITPASVNIGYDIQAFGHSISHNTKVTVGIPNSVLIKGADIQPSWSLF